jgi:hypothetical protein
MGANALLWRAAIHVDKMPIYTRYKHKQIFKTKQPVIRILGHFTNTKEEIHFGLWGELDQDLELCQDEILWTVSHSVRLALPKFKLPGKRST